jgi:hypothetical protein
MLKTVTHFRKVPVAVVLKIARMDDEQIKSSALVPKKKLSGRPKRKIAEIQKGGL